VTTRVFPAAGLTVVLLGENRGELGGSEWLQSVHGLLRGRPPVLDLDRERALLALLVELSAARMIRSAHDCAEGGFAVALSECCFDSGGIGVDVRVPAATGAGELDLVARTLFGESASRAIVSVESDSVNAVLAAARRAGVPAEAIGTTGGGRIRVQVDDHMTVDCALADAEARWAGSLAEALGGRVA
jgi:phosphoribosylformylglycinamidine synthase